MLFPNGSHSPRGPCVCRTSTLQTFLSNALSRFTWTSRYLGNHAHATIKMQQGHWRYSSLSSQRKKTEPLILLSFDLLQFAPNDEIVNDFRNNYEGALEGTAMELNHYEGKDRLSSHPPPFLSSASSSSLSPFCRAFLLFLIIPSFLQADVIAWQTFI